MPERLIVTAPASSANLGPGFDCLAVALELRNKVEIRVIGGGDMRVVAEGEGATEIPQGGADNLFVRAFSAAGGDPKGLEFHMTNAVPFARGLGSSAATIAAGVLAGRAWSGDSGDPFGLAVEIEGHPDNVAAALAGGIMLSWKTARGPQSLRLGPAPVEFVAVIPPYQLSTEQARAVIPPQVPLFDAVYTAARAALLVAAIEQQRPELIADALDDRLHEPYRAPLVPLLATVRERITDLPALGATLSGAGPTVLVWAEKGSAAAVAAGLEGLDGAVVQALQVAESGARIEALA